MSMELLYGALFPPPDSTDSGDGLNDGDSGDVDQTGGIPMSKQVVFSLQVAKNFQENTDPINSVDFSADGDLMISSADDDQIIMYNCETGSVARNLKSKKYGVSHVKFTHASGAVIHASTKIDDTIRYLSLHDNKYLRYFQGHTNTVTGLCMSPVDDVFLSVSLDKTLRMWDIRSPNCQGLMKLNGAVVAAIDPEGLVFSVVVDNTSLKLYDIRSFDKGPFSSFLLPEPCFGDWARLKFSPNGAQLLLTRVGVPAIMIIDAFEGKPVHTLAGHVVKQNDFAPEACFSPDSQFVFSGSEDGKIHAWNVKSGIEIAKLDGAHPRPVQCVQWNPKYMMMASACTNMALWLPRV